MSRFQKDNNLKKKKKDLLIVTKISEVFDEYLLISNYISPPRSDRMEQWQRFNRKSFDPGIVQTLHPNHFTRMNFCY